MEDAMILCKSAVDRGFAHGTLYKTDTVDLRTDNDDKQQFFAPDTRKPRSATPPPPFSPAASTHTKKQFPSLHLEFQLQTAYKEIEGNSFCQLSAVRAAGANAMRLLHFGSTRACLQGCYVDSVQRVGNLASALKIIPLLFSNVVRRDVFTVHSFVLASSGCQVLQRSWPLRGGSLWSGCGQEQILNSTMSGLK